MILLKKKVRYAPPHLLGVALALCFCFVWILQPRQTVLRVGMFTGSNWDVANANSFTILDNAITLFEERNPNVKVEYVSGVPKEEYSEWLAQRFLRGQSPDVFFILSEDFEKLASVGLLKNLDKIIAQDSTFDLDCFYETALSEGDFQNTQYALPYEVVPTLMFVNKTLLAREGFDIPPTDWTWEDLRRISNAVTRDTDFDGEIDQFGTFDYGWEEAVFSNNGRLFDADGRKSYLAESNVMDAIKYVRRLEEINKGQTVTQDLFDIGNVAFMPMKFSDYRTYKMYPYKISKYTNFQWDCITLPAGPKGRNTSEVRSLLIGISTYTKQEQAAWEFLKTLVYDKEIQMQLFEYSQGASVLREVTRSAEAERLLRENTEVSEQVIDNELLSFVIENGIVMPNFPKYSQAFSLIKSEVDQICSGKKEADSTIKILVHTLNRFLKQ